MYSLTLITAPTAEPITVAEAKKQLEIAPSYTAHDQHLAALITAARQLIESRTGLAICSQTWDFTFDRWPYGGQEAIYLPKSPTSSVTSVKYYDASGVQQTWSSAEYVVNTGKMPATIRRAYGYSWPTHRAQPDALTVRFVAGYGATAASVPQALKHAHLLLVSHWFDQRTPQVVAGSMASVAFSLDALLDQYRVGDEFLAYAESC